VNEKMVLIQNMPIMQRFSKLREIITDCVLMRDLPYSPPEFYGFWLLPMTKDNVSWRKLAFRRIGGYSCGDVRWGMLEEYADNIF